MIDVGQVVHRDSQRVVAPEIRILAGKNRDTLALPIILKIEEPLHRFHIDGPGLVTCLL
jgi:hypothetical protein